MSPLRHIIPSALTHSLVHVAARQILNFASIPPNDGLPPLRSMHQGSLCNIIALISLLGHRSISFNIIPGVLLALPPDKQGT
jgi:hypothetical protein